MTWEEAREKLVGMEFPKEGFREVKAGEQHSSRSKETHPLVSYTQETLLGGFALRAYYNVCPKCKTAEEVAEVRSKCLVLFNNEKNTAVVRYFVRNGKSV